MQNSSKTYLMLMLSFVMTSSLLAQKKFQSGNITTKDGTVIEGYINYKNWIQNPEKLIFKKELNGKTISYQPNELIQFMVADELYISAKVRIETSARDITNMTYDKKPTFRTDEVFLQSLFKGEKSLLYYKDKGDVDHLFIEKDGKYELLVYKKYFEKKTTNEIRNSTKKNVKEYKEYISQLSTYLSDCRRIQRDLVEIDYKKNDFVKLFKKYYDCNELEATHEKEIEKGNIRYGVIVGPNIGEIRFQGASIGVSKSVVDYLAETDFDSKVAVGGGFFLNYVFPRAFRRLSLSNELFYSSVRMTGVHDETVSTGRRNINTFDMGYQYINLNTTLLCNFPIGNIEGFVRGGFSNGFLIGNNPNYRKSETILLTTASEQELTILEPRGYEAGIIIGCGAKLNNIFFETRVESGTGVSNFINLTSKSSHFHFLVGYMF